MLHQEFTVRSVILNNEKNHRDCAAFFEGDTVLTHAEFAASCRQVAVALLGLGFKPGDRVAVISENNSEVVKLFGACALLGAIFVPLNWRLTPAELEVILQDCTPRALFVSAAFEEIADGLRTKQPSIGSVCVFEKQGQIFRPLAELSIAQEGFQENQVAASDPLALIYTAAVDGKAKGATLSHGNLIASALQLAHAVQLRKDDVFLGALPFFHVMAISFSFALQFVGGATAIQSRFDPAAAIGMIKKRNVTIVGSFPPMLTSLLDAAITQSGSLASLRACIGLDAPAAINRLQSEWVNATFWCGFGQTETTGMTTLSRAVDRPGASGKAGILTEVQIVDESGTRVGTNQTGEIVVRGPIVMLGYWQNPEETAFVTRESWHHTGDLGLMDEDNFLRYAGRLPAKELIKSGGENIYPAEVENVLRKHPKLADVAVIGLANNQWGEIAVALCVKAPDARLSADELTAFISSHIARYKCPKRFFFVDRIPRDAERRLLREDARSIATEASQH